jgi:hypothetical protein
MKGDELAVIESRLEAATPGPWYEHNTDDGLCMNSFYVGTKESIRPGRHDGLLGMDEDGDDQHEGEVVAITLLQYPRLAEVEDQRFIANTALIAHAPEDLAALIKAVRNLSRRCYTCAHRHVIDVHWQSAFCQWKADNLPEGKTDPPYQEGDTWHWTASMDLSMDGLCDCGQYEEAKV